MARVGPPRHKEKEIIKSDFSAKASTPFHISNIFFFSNFRRVLNVVVLGNSLASEFYIPTFRNTLSVPSS
jgi:hypothetical protein